jgi:DNA-binding MarR family transcriptional regulator
MSEQEPGSATVDQPNVPALAADLRTVVGRLVRRFREDRMLPAPQFGALGWLYRRGPKTTSELAALERVRQQSMAHTVQQMEDAGLVQRRADEHDGRKVLIELTHAGHESMEEFMRVGESWVSEAIESELSAEEQAVLARAIELMGRLVGDA